MMPLGVSVGDFIQAGELIRKVIAALNKSRGSAADYKALLRALISLERCLQTTSAVILSLSFGTESGKFKNSKAVINGIKYELECCKKLMEEFLCSSWKYTESLLNGMPGKKLKDEWRKVTWFIYKKDDVQKLERDLHTHIQAFQLYAIAVACHTSAFSGQLVEEGVQSSQLINVRLAQMTKLLETLTQSIPKDIGYLWEGGLSSADRPIRFGDALGRNMFIPLIFCSSPRVFHDILKVLFQHLPGQSKVQRKEYDLRNREGVSLLEGSTWKQKVLPGTDMEMSVFLQLDSKKSDNPQVCPRCDTLNSPGVKATMIQCCFCSIFFEVIEKTSVVELIEEVIPAKKVPQVRVQEIKKPTPKPVPRKVPVKNQLQEDLAFKRVSFVRNELPKRPTVLETERRKSDSTPFTSDDSPIFMFAKFGQVESVRSLLIDGADPNVVHSTDGTLLQHAARSGSIPLVQLLLEYGAQINAQIGHWGTALQAACSRAAYLPTITMVEFLLENGADVTIEGGHYGFALQGAAAFYGLTNNTAIVELLVANGAEINEWGGEYGTAISVAAYKGTSSLVTWLLEHGADIDARSPWGSALQASIVTDYGGGEEVAELLITSGANINQKGGDLGSPLHAAVSKNNDNLVRLLVNHGADLSMVVNGNTPLELATSKRFDNLVSILSG